MALQANRISVNKLLETKFEEMQLTTPWLESIGEGPEMSGVWFFWGHSGNGKTFGCLQLAKYLTTFSPVMYIDLEEGKRKTMKRAMGMVGIKEVARRFYFYSNLTFDEIREKMANRKSPRIVFINSYQYLRLTIKQYQKFKAEFPNHLIIFISHAEGKNPAGKAADFVRFDADVKVWCEGYRFFFVSRYGGGEPFDVWPEKAAAYWQEEATNG